MDHKVVRIGCPVGAWGDSLDAIRPMLQPRQVDYLSFEFLAEVTMALLARARARKPQAGYVPDFIVVMKEHLRAIHDQGIRVVTNAGGIHPQACADALREIADSIGITLKIAVVAGDDLTPMAERLRADGLREWRTDESLPGADRLLSLNAYLGAFPIARALDAGADVVITGRVVDSALVLGPLIHEFGWTPDSLDELAGGTLCGHLLECGGSVTGGNFTDWRQVEGWENVGYPIAEVRRDGTFLVTKAAGTGGLVSPGTVAEQLLYETGDPHAYLVPDVTLDLTSVGLRQAGENAVEVTGARGWSAPASLKATGTFSAGYRSMTSLMIAGRDAPEKAQRVGEAILTKTRRMFSQRGYADYTDTNIEVLGVEATYGPHARPLPSREVILKIGVRHPQAEALDIFAREIAPANIAMAPGVTGLAGRPGVAPVAEIFSCLLPKELVQVKISIDGAPVAFEPVPPRIRRIRDAAGQQAERLRTDDGPTVHVSLFDLAHGRSGDKGNDAMISVIARNQSDYPVLLRAATPIVVARYMRHVAKGKVTRFEVPGISALNFLLEDALAGGAVASLRMDSWGKALGQMLLDCPVEVPKRLALERGWAPVEPE
ncbi:acyclic terpene utilization AtuA family protein [Cupriavidus necator]